MDYKEKRQYFPFLQLPREIRDEIYSLLIPDTFIDYTLFRPHIIPR
jgi:hypothetical protein